MSAHFHTVKHVFVSLGWVKAVRKSNKKVRMGEQMASVIGCGLRLGGCFMVFSTYLYPVPRVLFDGWSYQDYMSVFGSEDEIEELSGELVDVAKVINVLSLSFDSLRFCRLLNMSLMGTLWPFRRRVSMDLPWSFGVSWAGTRESELLF